MILPSENPLLLHKDDLLSLICRYVAVIIIHIYRPNVSLLKSVMCRGSVRWWDICSWTTTAAIMYALFPQYIIERAGGRRPRDTCCARRSRDSTASVVVVRIYQQLLFPFRHGGNRVCSLLIFEEFTVLHHFVSLQGMFRNSYLSNVMLPYKATAAPGPYSALVFCVTGTRVGSMPSWKFCMQRQDGMQEMLDVPLGSP